MPLPTPFVVKKGSVARASVAAAPSRRAALREIGDVDVREVEEAGRLAEWRAGEAVTGYHEEDGTDLAAIAAGHIAVTPLHFDLLDADGMDALARRNLARLLEPATREVT